jgi:hypothetical protein
VAACASGRDREEGAARNEKGIPRGPVALGHLKHNPDRPIPNGKRSTVLLKTAS